MNQAFPLWILGALVMSTAGCEQVAEGPGPKAIASETGEGTVPPALAPDSSALQLPDPDEERKQTMLSFETEVDLNALDAIAAEVVEEEQAIESEITPENAEVELQRLVREIEIE